MEVYLTEKQLLKKKLVEKSLPVKLIKIEIGSGLASAVPPLGPLLGQYGINIAEFCKEFNEESSVFEKETLLPINVYFGLNKQYYFEFKLLSVSYLVRKYLESYEFPALSIPKVEFLKICYNIALYRSFIFYKDDGSLSELYLKNCIRCIIGTFKSFKYTVI